MYLTKMISVGIDISKDKSTVCILNPYGEIIKAPFEITHTDIQLQELIVLIKSFKEEVKVVLEATGNYHLPVLTYLKDGHIFVSLVNPLRIKKYMN